LNRPRTLGAVGAFCAVLVSACLIAASVSAALRPSNSYPLWSIHHRSAQPGHYVDGRDDLLVREDQSYAAWNADGEEEWDYRFQLPLALKNYYRLPPWSGDARFGFCVTTNPVEQYDVSSLYSDWYVAYPGFRTDPPPLLDLEFVQIIRLYHGDSWPSQEAVARYAKTQPGTLWLIGNEPDAPAQDCVVPAEYAQLYHQWYHFIKAADPCAKVAIGGVVQATPLRLQYLNMVLQEYQDRYGQEMPVDVWNVHGFILQEKAYQWGCQIPCGLTAQQGKLYSVDDHDDMTIFIEQIVRFRQWMKDHGQRNKPLIVSEYGILLPIQLGFDEPRVESFMLSTFDYFMTATSSSLGYPEDGNRLVQAWAWYSLDDEYFEGYESYSHLFDPDTKQITTLGQAYRRYAASH
jgi:hypothetical protein